MKKVHSIAGPALDRPAHEMPEGWKEEQQQATRGGKEKQFQPRKLCAWQLRSSAGLRSPVYSFPTLLSSQARAPSLVSLASGWPPRFPTRHRILQVKCWWVWQGKNAALRCEEVIVEKGLTNIKERLEAGTNEGGPRPCRVLRSSLWNMSSFG